MPVIHVHNAGPLDLEQRRVLAERLTQVIHEVTGKPHASVYTRIDEVPRDHFAVGGRLLADRDAERPQ
jgi:4-oxalocrotonate tautomerase